MPDDFKELPQAVRDAIATLKAHGDIDALVAELKGSSLYQAVFNSGHSEATERAKAKAKEQSEKVKAAEEKVTQLEGEVAELKKTQPELEKRDAAWQKKLDAKDAEIRTRDDTIVSLHGETKRDKLAAVLAGKLRPKIAKYIADEIAAQIHRKEDGSYELLEDGIPVAIPKGKTVWDVAAERAVKNADPEDVLSGADSGGGARGGNGGGGAPSSDELIESKRGSGLYRGVL